MAVVDETLLTSVDVAAGLKPQGALIINTAKDPEEVRSFLKGYYTGRICTIDAYSISMECLKAYFPNTPMLAAVVAVSGCVNRGQFLRDMEESYRHKFAKKPQVVEGNLRCLKVSLSAVKGQE